MLRRPSVDKTASKNSLSLSHSLPPTFSLSLVFVSLNNADKRAHFILKEKEKTQFAIWGLSKDAEQTELHSASRTSPLLTDFLLC